MFEPPRTSFYQVKRKVVRPTCAVLSDKNIPAELHSNPSDTDRVQPEAFSRACIVWSLSTSRLSRATIQTKYEGRATNGSIWQRR